MSIKHAESIVLRSVLIAIAGWAMCTSIALAVNGVDSQRELRICADPANLPYSNERGEGFENRIATLLASDLHASLRYVWSIQRRSFLRRTLKAGVCDVIIGLPHGLPGVAQTRPYYASTYVFVARSRDPQILGFDDPALRELRIGVQAVGAEGANPPPVNALARRGIVDRIVGFPMWGDDKDDVPPQARIVEAVANGQIDLAIVWGPFAGYFAKRYADELVVTPVDGDAREPSILFQFAMALSVRSEDKALRDELQSVLDRQRGQIDSILREYAIPVVPLAP